MVLPDSHKVSRVPWYLGIEPKKSATLSPSVLSPSVASLSREVRLRCGFVTSRQGCAPVQFHPTTPTVQRTQTLTHRPVWAFPVSLAATQGIAVAFFSWRYLDVSVPSVGFFRAMDSPGDSTALPVLGCPIRKSPGQRLLAPTRGLSQLATSFIAFLCQGIQHTPLKA